MNAELQINLNEKSAAVYTYNKNEQSLEMTNKN